MNPIRLSGFCLSNEFFVFLFGCKIKVLIVQQQHKPKKVMKPNDGEVAEDKRRVSKGAAIILVSEIFDRYSMAAISSKPQKNSDYNGGENIRNFFFSFPS